MANETEVWDRKHCVFCVFSLFVKSTAEAKKKCFIGVKMYYVFIDFLIYIVLR